MVHAQESGHWYDRQGKPVFEVTGAKGQPVTPDIRHARKLGLFPGVTTIIKCAAAPGLELWKQKQVLHAALTLPTIGGESEDAYLARIMADSREQGKKAAERGTAIHKAIQTRYEGNRLLLDDESSLPYVDAAMAAVTGWNMADWIAEKSFAHPLGYGGKTDLHSVPIYLTTNNGYVLDFKTKEFGADTKLETYDEHAMQLSAYREGLGMPKARCAIVYVSVTVPGLAKVIEIDETDLDRGWRCFIALLAYWKAKNNYDPAN